MHVVWFLYASGHAIQKAEGIVTTIGWDNDMMAY